jgi:hypothetical protein
MRNFVFAGGLKEFVSKVIILFVVGPYIVLGIG